MEDFSISLAVRKGFLIFLYSERMRHLKDVDKISKMITDLESRMDLEPDELNHLRALSNRYVDF